METCLLNYFVLNDQLKNSCDFQPGLVEQGQGVYEIVRVIGQRPLFLREHLDRFFRSLELADMACRLDRKQIRQRLKTLIESNGLKNGNLRFEVLNRQPESLFLCRVVPANYPAGELYRTGVKVGILQGERPTPNAKCENLPVRRQADRLLHSGHWFEVLLVNHRGLVTEGSRSNVFFIDDNGIHTPPRQEVLPGVTREKIIQLAGRHRIPLAEREVPLDELEHFRALFLSGTSIKVIPVQQVENSTFLPQHSLYQQMARLYDQLVEEDLHQFSW